VKYAGLAFAEIPQKEQDLSYDAQGLPVGESKDMPNLHGLVWQLRRAYGMLPEDELEEPVDESLTMMAISLSLHSSIGMNIYVNDAVIGDYDEVYVSVEKLYADGVYETAKLDAYTPAQVSGMACRSYCYNDLTSKEMTATVRITLYGVKDGVVTRGEIRDYSVLTYAKNTLAKAVAPGLKTLLVDMLNYGAQAQEYFGFHEEFLANSTLTAQEQALATVAEPDIRSYKVQDDPTIPHIEVTLIILPCFLFIISGITNFEYKNAAVRSMFITLCHSSSDISVKREKAATAALFIRQSICPIFFSASLTAKRTSASIAESALIASAPVACARLLAMSSEFL
jgi:hypothetical protein